MVKRKLIQRNNQIDSTKTTTSLYPDLPFQGIKGTIFRIEETEASYYKVLYNKDGTIDQEKKPVPKNKGKNLKRITDDYYNDLKKYLEANSEKYIQYKNISTKEKLTNKQLKLCIMIAISMVIGSFPILMYTTYVGAFLEAISILALYKTLNIQKDSNNKKEIKNFIHNYRTYQEILIEYNTTKTKQEKIDKTIYTEIECKEPSSEKQMPKIKILTKEETKEAA